MSLDEFRAQRAAAIRNHIDTVGLTEADEVDPSRWFAHIDVDDCDGSGERVIGLRSKTLEDAILEVASGVLPDHASVFDFHYNDGAPDWGDVPENHTVKFVTLFRISEIHEFDVDEYTSRCADFQKARDDKAKEKQELEQFEKLKAKFEKP